MGTEQLLITRIENGLRGLRLKTKTIEEIDIHPKLERLRKTNPNMADELEMKFFKFIDKNNSEKDVKKFGY